MRDGFRIMDLDRHVIEPLGMWREYLAPDMREHAPALVEIAPRESLALRLERLGEHALLPMPRVPALAGEPLLRGMSEIACIESAMIARERPGALEAGETSRAQLSDMDRQGVDLAVLLPTYAPFLVYNDGLEARRSRAFALAYNRWLLDFCSEDANRLLPAALISRHDPEAMVEDALAAARAGFRAVVMRPNPVQGRTLGSPDYDRFWSACEDCALPILLHEGTHTRVTTAGADRYTTHFGQHACSHPMEAMMALLSLIEGGVLEAHSRTRFAFLEAGCGWLPYWLWRLDDIEYAQYGGEVRSQVRMAPSNYFRRQCWVALEPGEALLEPSARAIGSDRLLFGTDFPHIDHALSIVDELFEKRSVLGDELLDSILWRNPRRLMGFDVEPPAGEARLS